MLFTRAKAFIDQNLVPEADMLKLERAGRTAYKSEDKIKLGSADKFIGHLTFMGHHSVIEHVSVTARFICDRGVSHEIVRHRIASYTQESTRYCNYKKDGIEVIIPEWFNKPIKEALEGKTIPVGSWRTSGDIWVQMSLAEQTWVQAMINAEAAYVNLINVGWLPEKARGVLPTAVKTEVVMTANLREWYHFFQLRALGTTGKPHPQIKEVAVPLLKEFAQNYPAIFGPLVEELGGRK